MGNWNQVLSNIKLPSHVWLFAAPWTAAVHISVLLYLQSLLKFMSLNWWHPTISSSVTPFSSCLQSFPASGSFPMSPLFTSGGGQSIRTSASASVLPMNIHAQFPFRLTSLIFLLLKGLSGAFSRTTVWKHQSFSAHHLYGTTLISMHDY